MKILIDLTSLNDNFSGIELYACNVAKELIKNKTHEFILVFKNEVFSDFLNCDGNVKTVVIYGKNKLLFQQFKLLHYLNKSHADLFLFFAFTQPFFFFHKNVYNTIHDVSCFDCKKSNRKIMIFYWKVMFKRIAWSKSKVFTVSQFSKERIIKRLKIKSDRVMVTYSSISNVIDSLNETNELNLGRTNDIPKKYILALSTVEPRKNFRLLLEAFSQLIDSKKIDTNLVIVGRKGWLVDTILKDISDEARKHILFTGFVEDKCLPGIYSNAEFFVFPSLYEGFGVPPLEALKMKTLVLSSDSSAMPEVLGDSVVFFENNNLEDLKEKIVFCETISQVEKNAFIRRGQMRVKRFTWESVGKLIEKEIYKGEMK